MTVWLQTQGHMVNRKRVQRLMQRMGLEAIYQRPAGARTSDLPLSFAWVGDHAGQPSVGGRHNVHSDSAQLSLPGRGHGLGEPLRPRLTAVESARHELLRRSRGGSVAQGRPAIFNTDQGSQFTDEDFTGVLHTHQVAISMDRRGRFSGNIFVERLWRKRALPRPPGDRGLL
jgi:putative transposase